jgi:DNA repair photolyase
MHRERGIRHHRQAGDARELRGRGATDGAPLAADRQVALDRSVALARRPLAWCTEPMFRSRGRGALSNPRGRFARFERVPEPPELDADGLSRAPATEVRSETARSILTFNDSPDIPFDRSLNAYRGCEHGCIYCYARPSHAYVDCSPGLEFESRLVAKVNAAALLERELCRPGYRCAPVALSSNTDAYQPIERHWRLTRGLLEVLDAFQHPARITTKSDLVLRDLDLLAPMGERRLAAVSISVTTLDAKLARVLEPRAPTPQKRLAAIRALASAGVPTGVLCAPLIPGINDAEIEAVLLAARDAGACSAAFELVRLPYELQQIFTEWLGAHFPERQHKVLELLKSCRQGSLNDSRFGYRQVGTGAYAGMLQQRCLQSRKRLGFVDELALDAGRFRVPPRPGEQLSLILS